MKRLLFISWMLIGVHPSVLFAQTSEHEDIEVIKPSATNPTKIGKANTAQVAQMIIDKTSSFRKSKALGTLHRDAELDKAANYFGSFMAEQDKYGHTADGNRPSQRAKKFGYDYCLVLENIAYQYKTVDFSSQTLAEELFLGWKDSPGHRKNMLDPDVTEIGVAVAQSKESGYYYAVQMFGRPKSQKIEFSLTNQTPGMIGYKIGERSFKLPSHYERTHTVCRPPELVLTSNKKSVEPEDGSKFVIEQSAEDGPVIKKKN